MSNICSLRLKVALIEGKKEASKALINKLDKAECSSFVARTIVHLAGEQMLRALDCDVTVGLVDVDVVLETLVDLLCETDLLLWHQFVR